MARGNEGPQPRLSDGTYTFWRSGELGGVDLLGGDGPVTPMDRLFGDAQRHAAMVDGGYVQPTFFAAVADPRSTSGIDTDWAQSFMSQGNDPDDDIPVLPDDYTADADRGGNALTGSRRIRRRSYEVDGWTFRFKGSVTAAKRYAREESPTFKMGCTIINEQGQKVTGMFRITHGGGGRWSVTPLGMAGPRAQMAAAGIQATLEASRPTMVPKHVGGLAARAREQMASQGVAPGDRLTSTWMDSVAYDDVEGMMVTRTSTGNTYGHSVSRSVFETIKTSTSPGAMFNALVRGTKAKPGAPRVDVTVCGKCGRTHPSSRAHRCPVGYVAPRQTDRDGAEAQRAAAARIAAGALRVRNRYIGRLTAAQPQG